MDLLNIFLDIRKAKWVNINLRVPPINLFPEAQNEKFTESHRAMLLVEGLEFYQERFFSNLAGAGSLLHCPFMGSG